MKTQHSIEPPRWKDIEEEETDEIDLQMLKAIEEDPDCHEFISEEELLKSLNLTSQQ